MAKIYLVRHTKPDIADGICYGALDVPVAVSYMEDAQKISAVLKDIPFERVFSSPLKRCVVLAQYLFQDNFITDERLSELNFGEWEGLTWEEIYHAEYGKLWMNNYTELPCPGGESYIDLTNRVKSFINELDTSKNTLVIAHAGVIRVILSVFKGISADETFRIKIGFGEVVELNINT